MIPCTNGSYVHTKEVITLLDNIASDEDKNTMLDKITEMRGLLL